MWDESHHQMAASPYRWGPKACGYSWTTTGHEALPHFLPLPLATVGLGVSTLAYRARSALSFSPTTLAAAVASDVVLNGLRLMVQYRIAESTAVRDAQRLAEDLRLMRAQHDKVRVVAHSLGCRKVLQAVALLGPGEAPSPSTTHPEHTSRPLTPTRIGRLLMSFTSARQPSSRKRLRQR